MVGTVDSADNVPVEEGGISEMADGTMAPDDASADEAVAENGLAATKPFAG